MKRINKNNVTKRKICKTVYEYTYCIDQEINNYVTFEFDTDTLTFSMFDDVGDEGSLSAGDYLINKALKNAIIDFKLIVFKQLNDYQKQIVINNETDCCSPEFYKELSADSIKWIKKHVDSGQISNLK